jgi:hypothetical protein
MDAHTAIRARAQTQATSVNKPIEPYTETVWEGTLLSGGGGENINLTEYEAAVYNADPDAFAAKYFGCISVEEYREWVASNGTPLCSERTKAGHLCSNRIAARRYGREHGLDFWRQHHRTSPCPTHGGELIREVPPDRCRIADDCRCEALAKGDDRWAPHRCGLRSTHVRDGRKVCQRHLKAPTVSFVGRQS